MLFNKDYLYMCKSIHIYNAFTGRLLDFALRKVKIEGHGLTKFSHVQQNKQKINLPSSNGFANHNIVFKFKASLLTQYHNIAKKEKKKKT